MYRTLFREEELFVGVNGDARYAIIKSTVQTTAIEPTTQVEFLLCAEPTHAVALTGGKVVETKQVAANIWLVRVQLHTPLEYAVSDKHNKRIIVLSVRFARSPQRRYSLPADWTIARLKMVITFDGDDAPAEVRAQTGKRTRNLRVNPQGVCSTNSKVGVGAIAFIW